MKLYIQSYNNFEITDTIDQFVKSKFSLLKKIIHDDSSECFVSLGRTTNHQKQGEVYRVFVELKKGKENFQVEENHEDLYAAIDIAKDTIEYKVTSRSQKKRSVFKKAAVAFKNLLRK
jgi:ribosomal subunit interface protein